MLSLPTIGDKVKLYLASRRSPINNRRLGYLLVITATACWASLGPLGKLSFNLGIGPQTVVTLRTITAIAIVFPALLIYRPQLLRLPRGSLPLFIALGLSVAINYSSFFQAVASLPVGVAISLFYLYPVLVTVGARFTLKERFPLEKTTALLIAVFGCSLVSGVWENSISISAVGIFFALASASGCAAYTLLVKVAVREHPPERVLAYSLAFALPFLLLANLLTREPVLAPYPLPAWGIILLLALVPTLLGYYLFRPRPETDRVKPGKHYRHCGTSSRQPPRVRDTGRATECPPNPGDEPHPCWSSPCPAGERLNRHDVID